MAKKTTKKDNKEKIVYTQNFAGVIRKDERGMNKLIIKSQRWYQHQLNKFKDGESVSLMVHNERPKRTEAQNKFYWGAYLPIVSKETGEQNLDRLHELFKGLFLSEGIVDVLGKKVRMKKSTTELGKAEFSNYIMAIENETGIQAPPTENFGLAPSLACNTKRLVYNKDMAIYKKQYKAMVLRMPRKLFETEIVFPIAFTYKGGKVHLSITNNPEYTPKIKEIIIITYG